ncbi:MAG: hypothetical protein R3C60_14140 [Parvularculaceae bacterium]
MKHAFLMTASAALLFAAACEHTEKPPKDKEAAMPADCPVLDSREWKAWVDAMPGIGSKPTLHVAGEVDMPTPGYTFDWEAGPTDRRLPPAQHINLVATPPDGMVTQVVTTETVKYEGEAMAGGYRAILVHCGDGVIAEITEVGNTQ